MSIFEYPFMQRAFLVGVLLALIIPCVGIVIVLKRLSMIGDALSQHLSGRCGGRVAFQYQSGAGGHGSLCSRGLRD